MIWSEELNPEINTSPYNHMISKTPLGDIIIEWESWKLNTTSEISYTISINGNWIGCEYNLQDAKDFSKLYLEKILQNLNIFLKTSN